MERIGVRELRQNASKWLRGVANGERYEVTVRGEPVAMLGPLPVVGDPIERLMAEGKLRKGKGSLAEYLRAYPPLPPTPPGKPTLSERLAEMRRDER